jgi:hypothetical protein
VSRGRRGIPHDCPACEKRRQQAIAAYHRNKEKRLQRKRERYEPKRKPREVAPNF